MTTDQFISLNREKAIFLTQDDFNITYLWYSIKIFLSINPPPISAVPLFTSHRYVLPHYSQVECNELISQ